MHTSDSIKIYKLKNSIHALLGKLRAEELDFAIYKCIDQYYYIQKMEELTGIHETPLRDKLPLEQLALHYAEVYFRWRRDVRWLNKHLLFNEPCPQTIPSFTRRHLP